jgi:succinyl-CoA synthetase beta subunit
VKLYEYEGKELFARNGIPVPKGFVASSPEEAEEAARKVGKPVVIKAQVLRGGRGKTGGVRFAGSPAEARAAAEAILGMSETVKSVLVEEKLDISQELYLSVVTDPAEASPLIMASASGGMDIEEVAKQTPERIVTEVVPIFRGLMPFQARRICFNLGIRGVLVNVVADIILKLYRVFRSYDAELVEINPLAVTGSGDVVAADAKVIIDDNALFRQRDFIMGRDRFEDEREYEAARYGLRYVKLDGNVGVLCTGAGLTMTVLDLIKYYGGKPANFLEFGGATYKNSYHALRLVLSDPDVRVVLINTFGLVARADVISEGLVQALDELKPDLPIVASIRGTGEEEARRILQERTNVRLCANVEEAVREAVRIAG